MVDTQKTSKNLILVSALLISVIMPMAFAANQLLPLHGRLASSGSPVSSGDLRVSISDAATGGNLVYDSGSDFNGTILNGIVDVMLGSSTNLDLNYGKYYYMDINVVATGSNTITNLNFGGSDRKQFESNRGDDLNVATLGNNSTAESQRILVAADGNVGIGTASPGSKLVVATAANGRSLVVNNSTGNVGVAILSAVPAYSLDVNGTLRVASGGTNGLFQASDANVGVRTVAPAGVLHVSNLNGASLTAFRIDANSLNTSGAATVVVNSAGTSSLVGINLNPPTYSLDVNGTFRVASNTAVTGLFQNSSANVGIGTLTPQNKLNVVGDLNVATSATAIPSLFVNSSDGNVGINTASASSKFIIATTANGAAVVVNNTTGNVGVNVLGSVPAYTLDVNGTLRVRSGANSTLGLFQASDANVTIGALDGKNRFAVVGDFNVSPSGLAVPSIYVRASDGNVGIGTNNPIRTLSVVGDVNVLGTIYATSLIPSNQWAVSGTNIYYTTGNVGANTTVPNNKLTVVGDLNVAISNAAVPSLFINSTDGNVAIASTTSGSRLYVKGFGTSSASNTLNVVNSNGNSLLFVNDAGSVGINNLGTAPAQVLDVNAGNTRLVFSSTGVGIGTTTPQNKLNLIGDLNVAISGTATPSMLITSTDGNVSINNIFATNKLTVVGDLNVTPAGTGGPALFVHPTTGNVGIAMVPNASYVLDVTGSVRASVDVIVQRDVNVSRKLIVQDMNVQGKIYRQNATAAAAVDACAGTVALTNTSASALFGSGVKVSTTCIGASSLVFVTRYQSAATLNAQAATYYVGARSAGASFDINSTLSADQNTVAWFIVEPA